MNPVPSGLARNAQLSDREIIRALRDRILPAEGDPVDVVDVRSDASDVVTFADIVGDIGAAASRTQQARSSVKEQLNEIAELRKQLEFDAFGQLPEDESEALGSRLRALEARSGEPLLPPAPADDGGGAGAPAEDFHAAVDARLQAVQDRLEDENAELAVREKEVVGRAERLQQAVGAEDEGSAVRLALETAQRIAEERTRAITAQTARLDAKNIRALSNG